VDATFKGGSARHACKNTVGTRLYTRRARDYRERARDVNEYAYQSVKNLLNHSQQPKNKEQGDDSPKHGVILSNIGPCVITSGYEGLQRGRIRK